MLKMPPSDKMGVTNSVGGSWTGHATPAISGGRVFVLFGCAASAGCRVAQTVIGRSVGGIGAGAPGTSRA